MSSRICSCAVVWIVDNDQDSTSVKTSLIVLWTLCCLPLCAQDAADTADAVTEFVYPLAVVSDLKASTVYVADRNLPGIWKVVDGKKSLYFRGSKTFRTPLNAVRCLAIDHEGHLLAGDSSTRDVYRFDESGKPHPLTNGWIGIPMAIAVSPDGTIYTADLELHRIWKMPSEGSEKPEEFAVINSPRGLTLGNEGNLWVLSTSSKDGQIQKVAPDGTITSLISDHPFNLPHNIVRMEDGSFFVTDNYEKAVWRVTSEGKPEIFVSGAPLDRPVGLCRHGESLLIADPHIRTIFSLSTEKSLSIFASSPVDSGVDGAAKSPGNAKKE